MRHADRPVPPDELTIELGVDHALHTMQDKLDGALDRADRGIDPWNYVLVPDPRETAANAAVRAFVLQLLTYAQLRRLEIDAADEEARGAGAARPVRSDVGQEAFDFGRQALRKRLAMLAELARRARNDEIAAIVLVEAEMRQVYAQRVAIGISRQQDFPVGAR